MVDRARGIGHTPLPADAGAVEAPPFVRFSQEKAERADGARCVDRRMKSPEALGARAVCWGRMAIANAAAESLVYGKADFTKT